MENMGLIVRLKIPPECICPRPKVLDLNGVLSPCYWLFILGRLQLALLSSLQETVGLFSVIMELTVHCQNDFNVQA